MISDLIYSDETILNLDNNYIIHFNIKMSDKNSDMDTPCDFCGKTFGKKSLLRHIGQSKACKSHYGPRFIEMKTKQVSERNENYKKNLTIKEKKKALKNNRIRYANNPDLKEKNMD